MQKHPLITEKRIENLLPRIRRLIHSPGVPLSVEANTLPGEPISPEAAMSGAYSPFRVGDPWGAPWSTTWFRFSGAVPVEWKGRPVVALVRLGGQGHEGFTYEGLVWRNGQPVVGLNANRWDVSLTAKAKGGETFVFEVEAAANPLAERYSENPGRRSDAGRARFTLELAELVCFEPDAWEFYHDFSVAVKAMRALGEEEPRRAMLRYALNEAANLFDEESPKSVKTARAALRDVLACQNGDTVHRVSAIGHAHIDTAWLWPLRETIRKCARTFSTVLAYMEEYPEFVFGCSQPQQYAWMKRYYPTIYDGIRKAVKRGQWEPIGAMWVEADCNIASGESLVRQILHGKNFFLDEFGVETTEGWLPDVFGCPAALPQLFARAGVMYFFNQKLSWNQLNTFPHHTFRWEGIDGTQVLTHFPPADTYNGTMEPRQLLESAHRFREKDRTGRSLYAYGFGDGGGGPTRTMLEYARRLRDFEGMPPVAPDKVSKFFSRMEREARDLPVWVGELYLELHRGTFTTHAGNKRENRKCEFLLRDAEFFDVAAAQSKGERVGVRPVAVDRAMHDVADPESGPSVAAHLDRAWKLLLLNQFHDIIPGTSIGWVYEDSARDYATVRELGGEVLQSARSSILAEVDTSGCEEPYVVWNTCSFDREEIVSLPDGRPAIASVPACGYAVIDGKRPRAVQAYAQAVSVEETSGEIVLDNGIVRVALDSQGLLSSVWDHREDREVISRGQRGNVFQLHRDYPNNWDAWDVDLHYRETVEDLTTLDEMQVEEALALRATVRIVRKFGNSRISQLVQLNAGSARVDFQTEVDWQESHRFLKVAFPVEIHATRATYEIQYGYVERPTHMNTSWDVARFEVCAQKWADLSENDYGVALLNDCKYGYDILGNVMRLSLLRATTAPDANADRGLHAFTYSLFPHRFGPRTGEVVSEAYALNNPLQVSAADGSEGAQPAKRSFFSVDRAGVIIESIKHAERESAVIVRLYEAHGTRGPVTLKTTLPFSKAWTADLLERTLGKIEIVEGEVKLRVKPFEIVTLKLQ